MGRQARRQGDRQQTGSKADIHIVRQAGRGQTDRQACRQTDWQAGTQTNKQSQLQCNGLTAVAKNLESWEKTICVMASRA